MRIESGSSSPEVYGNLDLNKILDDLGVPTGVKRVAALAALGSLLLGGAGVACAYGSKTAESIGPDPNLSCPGDFDVNKGVMVNKEFEYMGLGTTGNLVEIGDDYMTEFNNGQLRLLRHVYGGKKLGDVNGWSFKDEDGKTTNGSIQFSEDAQANCEDK